MQKYIFYEKNTDFLITFKKNNLLKYSDKGALPNKRKKIKASFPMKGKI